VKKIIPIALILIVIFCACNRKAYVKKLTGTWKMSRYIINENSSGQGQDETKQFEDTTHVNYALVLNGDQSYMESWVSYYFYVDSTIISDTTSIDSAQQPWVYHITYDTLRPVKNLQTPHAGTGQWVLINSEQDLELRPYTDTTAIRMFNIWKLTTGNFNLFNNGTEYDLVH
jgi:hypothetical protein